MGGPLDWCGKLTGELMVVTGGLVVTGELFCVGGTGVAVVSGAKG